MQIPKDIPTVQLSFRADRDNITEANIDGIVAMLKMLGEEAATKAFSHMMQNVAEQRPGHPKPERVDKVEHDMSQVWDMALARFKSGGNRKKLN